ncbi:hypothetical protein K503DRAFT_870120 [Rhizopogon vinicolor AM-OR11-026]|uniref:WD40 repeat-like protein n=1 Tax=Rhizopogon vinicolor AM-OR11-026 TaxID=1314800 RepID=A0A1B7MIS9_9AGAM|nr:hypothetical protein K503DRAFT_870120 [Rhizopogon vinicolor AM-OR11-026]
MVYAFSQRGLIPIVLPYIRERDTSTWKQVGEPWTGHTNQINALAVIASGTLLASASSDNCVCFSRCVTFSADGKYILSGGVDQKVSGWAIYEVAFSDDALGITDKFLFIPELLSSHLAQTTQFLCQSLARRCTKKGGYALSDAAKDSALVGRL